MFVTRVYIILDLFFWNISTCVAYDPTPCLAGAFVVLLVLLSSSAFGAQLETWRLEFLGGARDPLPRLSLLSPSQHLISLSSLSHSVFACGKEIHLQLRLTDWTYEFEFIFGAFIVISNKTLDVNDKNRGALDQRYSMLESDPLPIQCRHSDPLCVRLLLWSRVSSALEGDLLAPFRPFPLSNQCRHRESLFISGWRKVTQVWPDLPCHYHWKNHRNNGPSIQNFYPLPSMPCPWVQPCSDHGWHKTACSRRRGADVASSLPLSPLASYRSSFIVLCSQLTLGDPLLFLLCP